MRAIFLGCVLILGFGAAMAESRETAPLAETERLFLEFLAARDASAYLETGHVKEWDGAGLETWNERLVARHKALTTSLARLDTAALAPSDQAALAAIRVTLGDIGDPAPAAADGARREPRCEDRHDASLDREGLTAALRACFREIGNTLQFEGGTVDRGGALGLLAELDDPARRKAVFDAFLPLWAAINGANEPDSPYRRVLKMAAANDPVSSSGITAAARSIGVTVDDVERWLAQILAAWRDANPPDLVEPWDYRFYAEKVRKEKYDLDFNEVKPYMQMDKLREGMFWVAGELFGLKFEEIADAPVFHPDVRVWKVTDRARAFAGLWYFDPYARPGKNSGAWMTEYRGQQKLAGDIQPIVSNNCNYIKGKPGEPVLISWDDAETLFHEFGHALHGLLSNVKYPSQAGTNVPRDYVEFPSQVLERWLSTPEVMGRFLVHYETGEPLPQELADKIKRAKTFNQGFATVEFLGSALVDMKLHLAGEADIDPDKFEREMLSQLGMPSEIVMRHRTPQFGHIFSGEGYAAGYYSYLWADAITADAAEAFVEAGSFYDKETAKRFHDHIMSVGDSLDPAEGFRKFRGRDVDTTALLRDRGFPAD